MHWTLLFLAGLFEVAWAVGLKYTDGFSKLVPSALTVAAMVTSVGVLLPAVAQAAPPVEPVSAVPGARSAGVDDLPSPLEDKRRALRAQAVSDVVSGKAKAVAGGGGTPTGSFSGSVSRAAPKVRIANDGKTVIDETR